MSRRNSKTKKQQKRVQEYPLTHNQYPEKEIVLVNRQFKDALFCMLFNNKEALLSLYNAINHSSYQDPDELEITTIQEVIYMGVKSDSFPDKSLSCLECTATVLNVNPDNNKEILEQCRLLYDYALFLETARTFMKEMSNTPKAIDKAVTDCIRREILTDFLLKHRAEVINVLLTEYNEELHLKATYEEGHTEGHAEGQLEKAKETAMNLHSMGMDPESIAKAVNLDIHVVLNWLDE